jgi:hypothetical protein
MDDSARGGQVSQWGQWDGYADQLRKQLPPAPEGLLNLYVSWAPWLAIIFGAISLFLLVVAGLIFTALSPFLLLGGASGVAAGLQGLVGLILGIAGAALSVLGGYWMLQRRLMGWRILALGIIIGALNDLVHLAIIGLIIVLLIGYIHLQVKPRYN